MDTENIIIEHTLIEDVRKDFPIFSHPRNRELVYLDSAATAQRPTQVLQAWDRFSREINANAHRGAYRIAEQATIEFENARDKVANFIGAASSEQIVFTRGATESANLAAWGWALKFIKKGDEIIISELEHHSNLVPWQMAATKTGAVLKFIPFDEQGQLDFQQFSSLLSARTKLVALTHMSNVMGTPVPVEDYIRAAHEHGALVLVDGSQAVPHFAVNVTELDADFYIFSGHKMLGPMGTGALYAKSEHLQAMDPMLFGGSMIEDVDYTASTWNEVPWKFEAGTQNIPGIIGLGAAVDYINKIGINNIREHDRQLTEYALTEMQKIQDLQIYGPLVERGPVIAFSLQGIHPHDLATFLDSKNVAIRSGHHCAKLIMKKLHVPATARASFYLYNTVKDIDLFIKSLDQAKEYFSKWN